MLPDRRYLALHAAACRIGHLSGTIRLYSLIEERLEENFLPQRDQAQALAGMVSIRELWPDS